MTLPRIGVFDSGVGGLTVLKALAERLPARYFYFGDTARLPYGTNSADTVARYAIGATRFLESQKIDLLVIACNTASALALPQIKQATTVPVVGVVEPGAAMASQVSQSRRAVVSPQRPRFPATPIETLCSAMESRRLKRPAHCLCRWWRRAGRSIL